MSTYNRLSEVFRTSMEIPFDDESKIVLISDCHKGDGTWADDFSRNQNIFYSALKYYYINGFTYIDLGDSDELWKNRDFSKISNTYTNTFRLIHDFYKENRLYMIYGNHDIVKRNPAYVKKHLRKYYDSSMDLFAPLFDDIKIHEGLILTHTKTNQKIFMVHGHQGDLIADVFWRLGRFLSRNIWRRIESLDLRDPTSAALNIAVKKKVERKVIEWVIRNKQMIVCGHTHRPSCPSKDSQPYFNTGCCTYPNCITCIEIVNSEISLIKWDIKTNKTRVFYVDREVIAVPWKIENDS